MEVRRTVPVKLDLTESDAALLHDTIDQFRDAANHVVRHARDDDGYVITSKRRLHDRTYEDVHEATDLHANLVQAARSRAAEALKSVLATWKRGKTASLPHFTSPFLAYDQRSATFHDDHASLSTVKGRITAEYVLPDPQYTSQRCSHTDCGFTHPDNRPSQDSFCCQKCGYEIHADYNAAKNVGFKYLRRSHMSSDGDAPVGVRINTGTLNTSGFEPAPDSVRVRVHGESPAL